MTFGFGKNDSEGEGNRDTKGNFSGGFKLSKERNDGDKQVYIGAETKLKGDVNFSGPTFVDCQVRGKVDAEDSFTAGPCADIEGDIEGTEVVISGKVMGNINASRSISLERPAEVRGNLKAPKISIADGVIYNGNCSMKPPAEIVDLKRPASIKS